MRFWRYVILLPAAFITMLSAQGPAAAQQSIMTSDEMLQHLLPDAHAEGVYRSWKGLGVTPGKKAENKDIPKFDIHVNFDFGKDTLTTDGELLLSELGRTLINPKLDKYVFFLAGHTDAVGSDASNLDLSKRRADRVRNYLIDQFGISPRRLITKGYGESRLLLPNDPNSPLNRRVEITNIGPENG